MQIDLDKLISMLPSIMIYIVPGVIYLATYRFVVNSSKKVNEKNLFSFSLVIISFILSSSIIFLLNLIGIRDTNIITGEHFNFSTYYFLILFFSFGLGLLLAFIRKCSWIEEQILRKYLNRTFDENMWFSLADKNLGCWINVFMNEKNSTQRQSIYGIYYKSFSDSNGTWLVISQYIKYDIDNNIVENYSQNNERMMVVSLKDVNTVEIIYQSNSKKIHEKGNVPLRVVNSGSDSNT